MCKKLKTLLFHLECILESVLSCLDSILCILFYHLHLILDQLNLELCQAAYFFSSDARKTTENSPAVLPQGRPTRRVIKGSHKQHIIRDPPTPFSIYMLVAIFLPFFFLMPM